MALPGWPPTGHCLGMSEAVRRLSVQDALGEATDDHGAVALVRLHVVLPASVDLARGRAVFGDEARTWLGEPAGTDAAGLRRYRCDLRLRVSPESRAMFRKSAIVSLGVPQPDATVGGSWSLRRRSGSAWTARPTRDEQPGRSMPT